MFGHFVASFIEDQGTSIRSYVKLGNHLKKHFTWCKLLTSIKIWINQDTMNSFTDSTKGGKQSEMTILLADCFLWFTRELSLKIFFQKLKVFEGKDRKFGAVLNMYSITTILPLLSVELQKIPKMHFLQASSSRIIVERSVTRHGVTLNGINIIKLIYIKMDLELFDRTSYINNTRDDVKDVICNWAIIFLCVIIIINQSSSPFLLIFYFSYFALPFTKHIQRLGWRRNRNSSIKYFNYSNMTII